MIMLEPSADNPLNLQAFSNYITDTQSFYNNIQDLLCSRCFVDGVNLAQPHLCDKADSQTMVLDGSIESDAAQEANLFIQFGAKVYRKEEVRERRRGGELIPMSSSPPTACSNIGNNVDSQSPHMMIMSTIPMPSSTPSRKRTFKDTTATSSSSSYHNQCEDGEQGMGAESGVGDEDNVSLSRLSLSLDHQQQQYHQQQQQQHQHGGVGMRMGIGIGLGLGLETMHADGPKGKHLKLSHNIANSHCDANNNVSANDRNPRSSVDNQNEAMNVSAHDDKGASSSLMV